MDSPMDRVHAALQALPPTDADVSGHVLTGWVAVTEWMDADGDRWLTFGRCPSTTSWAGRGMLAAALDDDGWMNGASEDA